MNSKIGGDEPRLLSSGRNDRLKIRRREGGVVEYRNPGLLKSGSEAMLLDEDVVGCGDCCWLFVVVEEPRSKRPRPKTEV